MNQRLQNWIIEIKKKGIGPALVQYYTHKPTENELNNLCYLSMKYLIGWEMRTADFQVCMMLGGDPQTVTELEKTFIPSLADYIWDHLMGEPNDPTSDDLIEGIKIIRDMLYSMDQPTREAVTCENLN